MNILILGGNSEKHKEWVRQVASALELPKVHALYMDYLHWGRTEFAYIPAEVDRAAELVQQFSGPYAIIAKSVGTGITLTGISQRKLNPERCVFLGFPLKGILMEENAELGYAQAFKSLPPTVIVQNEHDPWGTADEVRQFVSSNGNGKAEVIATPGDTHDYVDFELIKKLALSEQ